MFLFPNHQRNFENLLERDRTHPSDIERRAMFYIFAGNDEIMGRIDDVYEFGEGMIHLDTDNWIALVSSGARALILLGYNLYNGYPCGTIMDVFRNLDELNCELAINGIRIRLGRE